MKAANLVLVMAFAIYMIVTFGVMYLFGNSMAPTFLNNMDKNKW